MPKLLVGTKTSCLYLHNLCNSNIDTTPKWFTHPRPSGCLKWMGIGVAFSQATTVATWLSLQWVYPVFFLRRFIVTFDVVGLCKFRCPMTSIRQKTIRLPNDFQVPLVSALLEPTCLRNIKNGALDAGHRLRLCAWDFDWHVLRIGGFDSVSF